MIKVTPHVSGETVMTKENHTHSTIYDHVSTKGAAHIVELTK